MKPNLKSAVLLGLGGVLATLSLLHLLAGQTTLKLVKPNLPLAGPKVTFKLQLQSGSNGVIYAIQSSTNLVNWQTVLSGKSKPGAVIQLADISATNHAQFFRVREFGSSLVDSTPPGWTNGVNGQFVITPPATVSVGWSAAEDDVGVANYLLYVNGVLVTNVSALTLSYTFTLDLHQSEDIRIQAQDASGNSSDILELVYLPGDKILAAANDGGGIYTFYVQTNGVFSAARQIASLNSGSRGLALGDLDHDGILDLIAGGASGDTLMPFFFKGKGDGTFAVPVALPTAQGAGGYMMDGTIGDFDGDGNLDFVFNGNSGNAFFYWGNGDGTFTLDVKGWGCCGRGMVAGDFNEDGREDIVRGRYSDGQLKVYLSNGDRTFIETNVIGNNFGNNDPYAVAAGDFDEDGHLDIIVAGGSAGDVTFLQGLGDGTFTNLGVNGAWTNLNVHNYGSADAFDYNGDGHLDLAMVTYSSQTLYFWPGNGDGTFSTNRLTLGSGLGNVLGISAPPRPPRVDVDFTPLMPVINLNESITYSAAGAGVTSNDFFRWTFGDTGTNPLAWTFGPGTNNLGQTVSHAYTKEGRFVTRLWHTATNGINSVRGTWVTVKGAPPVANPGGPYLFGELAATQAVWYATLDGSASTDDFGIVSYIWDFGDGTVVTNTGPKAMHGWPGSGVWPVTLTVVDAARLTGSNSTTITFTPGAAPVAVINGPDVVDETAAHSGIWSATFYATNSTDDFGIWKYAWNFGNGQTASGPVGQTTFSAIGLYTVTLTVTDNAAQTNSTTHSVTVKANGLPVPVIHGPRLLTVDVATNGLWYGAWDGLASTDDTGIYRYNWNFGDGATGSGVQTTHNYAGQGVYPLTLTVTDNGNQSVTATQNVIVVAGSPPVARITASTLAPEGAQPISFSGDSSTSDRGIYLYTWFLPPRQFDFVGQYLDPNQWSSTYTVQNNKLTVTGQGFWGGSYFFSIGTLLQRGCAIQGQVDTPSIASSHAMVGLKNLNITSGQYGQYPYALYFADGAVRIYENGGNRGEVTNYLKGTAYDFRIETKSGAGARYYLRPSGTGQAFTLIFDSNNYTDASFSFGADVYTSVWSFEQFEVDHVFATGSNIKTPVNPGGVVTLQVVDNALLTNSTSVVVTPIIGLPPVAGISGPTNGQAGVQLAFDGYSSSDDYAIASYTWDFGDGSPPGFGPAVTHSYGTTGTYTNTLTVMDYADQSASASLVVTITGSNALVHVPWLFVNGIEQPHSTYAGKTNTLKAVARGIPVPFTNIWDFGDASGTVTNVITNSALLYNLEARHAYTGGDGTPYYAGVTVILSNGTVLADTYPLLIRTKTIDIEEQVAIDEGLWYMQKTQNRYDFSDGTKGGDWISVGYKINATASSVSAFAVNGHLMTDDANRDPYVDTVQRGVNYLLNSLSTVSIGMQPYGNPDGNGNGIGLQAVGQPIYETGALMDALVAAGRAELIAPSGGANVKGRALRDIMQDMVDMHAWGQYDDPAVGGGWRYSWNTWPDNSACQWAAIGMLAAERFWGITAPQWVKDLNLVWLNYSEGTSGFGYTGPGDGIATTPSAMVQLAYDGITTTNALWQHGENYLANNWTSGQNIIAQNNVYANYAIAKSLRTANPQAVHNFTLTGKDWFLDPNNGLARVTIDRQFADGSWTASAYVDTGLASPWSVLILSSSLFQQGPVAVINVKPNPSAIGYPVVFDGSGSYHKHPGYKIVNYRWIFDSSKGLNFDHPDAVGPVVTNVFGSLSTNTVFLQVRDNSTPQLLDAASVVVQTTIPPYPPTVDAGGPYVACVGQDVQLDGSGSFCVDAAAGNFIQSYDWEVHYQVPVTFNQGVSGVHAVVTNGYPGAGNYTIGLRVKNANSIVYTNFAFPDVTADAFTTVYVYDRVIPDLKGRPKGNKCQLTWTKTGDYAIVMRSQISGDRGFEEVGRTDSSYATFLDANIEYNVEYYYRVYACVNGRPDPFGVSDAEFVVSFPRNFDERPPQFQSTPLRVAQVGQLYSVMLDVRNPVNEPLYFSVLAGPANLSVNPTNGNVLYVPTPDQIGNQPVSFQVTNDYGRDVLSYTLFVFPASNHPPVAVVNGPYAALTGQDIQFSSAGTRDPDNNPLRYYWNFGDGSTSTNPNPVHAYGGIGDYLVSLFVNDGYGGTTSAQTYAQITRPNVPPVAIVSNGPSFTVRLGETLVLDGSPSYSPLGNPLTYNWLWGDGAVSNNAPSIVSHRYGAGGPYPGGLIVADNRGGSNTCNFQVTVGPSNRPPIIAMTVSTSTPYVESTVTFDATASTDPEGDPMTFAWDFGDRSKTTGPLVTHVFHQISDFTVTLTVADNHGGVTTATQLIHALNAPPVFTSNPPLLTRAGTNCTYTPAITDADGDSSTFELITGPVTMSCDTNSGTLNWLPGTNNIGPNSIVLRATDANGASTDQSFTLVVSTALGPQLDLEPTHIEMTNVVVDSQTLAISGTVRVYLRNNGSDPVPVPFTVSVFVDADFDDAFSTNADYVVGYGVFPAGFPGDGSGYIDMTVNGQALFKDCPLDAFVDSQNVVPEYNKLNNIMRSGSDAPTNTPPVIDLSASLLQVGRLSLPTNALLTARLGNSGLVPVPTNVPMAFYDGNPTAGGQLIGVAHSTAVLSPGMYQDLRVTWAAPTITTHTVFVVADDPGTGTNLFQEITLSNNTFSVVVDLSAILPPVADAGPDQTVYMGDTVVLNGRISTDPQAKPLTYQWSILSIPIGSQTRLTGANTVSPSFQADAAGPYTVQLVVNNGLQDSTNNSTVKITAVDTNTVYPPSITSTPSFQGMVNVLYTYQVLATDPQNKPLTFRLPQAPAGMTINTNTGLVRWTPTNTGSFLVQVAADGVGGSAFQGYSLTIIAYTNLPPQFTSTPVLTALPNALYSYTAVAVDPNLDTVTYSLTQKPSGMAINAQSGLVTWTPTTSQMGGNSVTVAASDGHGGTVAQTFNLVVMNPGVTVLPIPDQTATTPDTFSTISLDSYVRDPNYAASQVAWTVTGTNLLRVNIDSNRVATITYPSGTITSERLTFLATDPDGKSGYTAPLLTVRSVDNPPVAAIANLSDDETTSIDTGFFELKGTADDPDAVDVVAYRVSLYDASSGARVTDITPKPVNAAGWHEGRVRATGSLGTLDFTLVRNGTYTLMLEVLGGTQTASASADVALDSELKIGRMKLSQQDLILPVGGVALAVVRTYDSLNLNTGDFGYSWTYSISDLGLTINEQRVQAQDLLDGSTFSLRVGGSWDVTLDMPDTGRRVTFRSSIQAGGFLRGQAVWTPPLGVHATLVPTCSANIIKLWGLPPYWEVAGIDTALENFDFPGFILTLQDGTQYRIDRNSEGFHYIDSGGSSYGNSVTAYSGAYLTRITSRTGNRTEFVREGAALKNIEQYDNGANKLKSLLFERDSNNRVTAIYTPADLDANGVPVRPPSVTYEYDSVGNLIRVDKVTDATVVTNPVYATTAYLYGNPRFPHYLTEVKDPRGFSGLRTEYDSEGRLMAVIDANGNRTRFDRNVSARTETVYDPAGNPSLYAYDAWGRVMAITDALGGTTTYTYDSSGNQTSVTDPLGGQTQKEYDSAGNLLALTGPAGQRSTFTYDDTGNLLSATDAGGHTTTQTFNSKGELLTKVNALGSQMQHHYDASGNLSETIDALGNTANRYGYDAAGNTTSGTLAGGLTTFLAYDQNGNQTQAHYTWTNPANATDVRQVVLQRSYDASGNVIRETDRLGNQRTTTYDAAGKALERRDQSGNLTTYTYDPLGHLLETKFPDDTVIRTVYDESGRACVTVDRHVPGTPANGSRSIYDAAGRVVRTERLAHVAINIQTITNTAGTVAHSHFAGAGEVLSFQAILYDAAGRVLAQTNAASQVTRYEYDQAGRKTAAIDALGNRSEWEYDAGGRIAVARDPLGREVHHLYDAVDRRVRTVFSDGTSLRPTYDALGRIIAQTDQAGKTRQFEYNPAGWQTAVTLPDIIDPEATNAPVAPQFLYGRDQAGNLSFIQDAKGRQTILSYDQFNQQLTRTLPLGQTEAQSYDAFGRLARKTNFNGQVTQWIYDSLNRVSRKDFYAAGSNAPSESLFYTYDSLGRVQRAAGSEDFTQYAYDVEGRVIQVQTPAGTIDYEYDATIGRRTRARSANLDTRYGYDALDRLKTVAVVSRNGLALASPEVTTYSYDAAGNRQAMTLPNGILTQYTYDALNRLAALTHQNAAHEVLADYRYALSADGRRTNVIERLRQPDGSYITNRLSYLYDTLNRLARESATVGTGTAYTLDYQYDMVGNRLQRRVTTGGKTMTTAYLYDQNDRLLLESNIVNTASGGAGSSLLLWRPDGGKGAQVQRPPSAWCYYAVQALPYALLVSFLLPALWLPRRRWRQVQILTADLHPDRALLPRCLAGFLAALMAVTTFDWRVLAQDAILYANLSTDTWGSAGAVVRYEYDDNGSVTRKVTTGPQPETVDYTYNLGNRLATVTNTATRGGKYIVTVSRFSYNQDGIRVRSESGTFTDGVPTSAATNLFLIDSFNPTGYAQVREELSAPDAVPVITYTLGDDIIAQTRTPDGMPGNQYFLYDGHGSTRQLADASGAIVSAYGYEAFGILLDAQPAATGATLTKLLYAGEQFDNHLQQYYLRARYYDPANGRFTTMDPSAGSPEDPPSLHKYNYAAGDPINGLDPSGQNTFLEIKITTDLFYVLAAALLTAGIWRNAADYFGGNKPDASQQARLNTAIATIRSMVFGPGRFYGSFCQAIGGLERARLRVVDISLSEFYARTQTQMFKEVLWISKDVFTKVSDKMLAVMLVHEGLHMAGFIVQFGEKDAYEVQSDFCRAIGLVGRVSDLSLGGEDVTLAFTLAYQFKEYNVPNPALTP